MVDATCELGRKKRCERKDPRNWIWWWPVEREECERTLERVGLLEGKVWGTGRSPARRMEVVERISWEKETRVIPRDG